MQSERLYRIGEKLVSLDKAVRLVGQALELREQGYSQQETAKRLSLDRSFVSRLETVGEIRKGNRLAVIGFPLANADEITALCREYDLDFHLILNNNERWAMVQDQQALDFFNRILELAARLRQFDLLIMITSEKWYQLAGVLLDIEIIHHDLGPSPIDEDRFFDLNRLEDTLKQVLKQQ
ncbi:MAG: transcriptional regulator [Bacillota bacterium]